MNRKTAHETARKAQPRPDPRVHCTRWVIQDPDGMFFVRASGLFNRQPVWSERLEDARIYNEGPYMDFDGEPNVTAYHLRVARKGYNPAPQHTRPQAVHVNIELKV